MKTPLPFSGYLVILLVLNATRHGNADRGDYIGCYIYKLDDLLNVYTGQSVDVCLSACEQLYYKYAIVGNGSNCYCGNAPGTLRLPLDHCNVTCTKNDTQKCGGEHAVSVYDTEITSPGPPASFAVVNFTETTVRVRWTPPQAHTLITGYILRAQVLHTFSDIALLPLEWRVSNETLHSEMLNLQPGSSYLISVAATNQEEEGPNKTITVETEIGTPSPTPPDVEIVGRKGDKLIIHIPEAKNVNGPVTMYRIVVSIELYQQGYLIDNLGNYTYAQSLGLPYYITAEIDPDDIKYDFIVGNNKSYNGFFNAPLPLISDIEVFLGVVSEKNFKRKIRYAESTKKIILNINEPEEFSPLITALAAAVSIGVVLLLIGVGLLIVLRKRIHMARLKRSSQSMPLSLSEPCVEIENAGFLQDEDERVDYYGNLKRKLWNIPRNLIDIDISCVVGTGTFGKFTRGKVKQQGAVTPGLVQVIADRELEKPDKKIMLSELDILIKSSEHENVISLIGICETNTTLFVVLQDSKQTLKDFLLKTRQRDLQNNKFCLITELKVLEICQDVAQGMEYLHSKKIMHKQLCCRNVLVTDRGQIKVSGFGLSYMKPLHEIPDYTRWTAQEILRKASYNPKADVWSYGCTLWEIVTIGATPFFHTPNKDVASRIMRGMRPSQPSYISDDLFHVCLQSWQVDPDERPTFSSILREVRPMQQGAGIKTISFTHYSGFEYEPYIPEYEVS